LISSAALAAEILLTRLFAIVHWHHFAYMVISLALLGFGASGTFLALAQRRLQRRFAASYLASVLGFAVLLPASAILARALPLRVEALLWDPWQPLWLLLMFVVLSLPFFCAATAIGLALTAFRAGAGRVYAADLVGAGLGSLGVLLALYLIWPEDVLRLIVALGLVSLVVGTLELRLVHRGWVVSAAVVALVAVAATPVGVLRFEPGPYKGLSQALLVTGTRVVLERSSPLGRVSVIESPFVPLRVAPGLSLGSTSEPPPQLGVFVDGEGLEAVTAASHDERRLAFLAQTTSAVGYRIASPRRVLVIGAGGGMEILRARRLGARQVDATELNPQIAQLLAEDLRDYTGGLLDDPAVRLHVGDARGFLAASRDRYDLIQMSLPGGAAAAGLGGLNEDYATTVEAFELHLSQLEPGGYLSVTSGAQVPPKEALKLVATAVEALGNMGVPQVADRLALIRGWQTATLLVKNGRLTSDETRRLRDFCDEWSFDVAWLPGIRSADANVYNQLPGPWYYEGVQALLGPERDAFISTYPFDIRPATDERPYFHSHFRWPMLGEAWRSRDRGGMALLEAGYLVLALTLLVALAAGLALILLPLRLAAPLAGVQPSMRWRVFAYFAALGLAFLFVEIAFLQKLVLLVHHPTIAMALVLATFLLAAGAGSAWSSRVPLQRSRRVLALAVTGIVVFGAVCSLTLDALAPALAVWPMAARGLFCVALLAPLAFCMGIPFPLALRELDEPLVPWAWAINGCLSVASAALATLVAVDFGFTTVLWVALALYVFVPAVFPQAARPQR